MQKKCASKGDLKTSFQFWIKVDEIFLGTLFLKKINMKNFKCISKQNCFFYLFFKLVPLFNKHFFFNILKNNKKERQKL